MIKRTIYLSNLSDLDLNNVGCHFTKNLAYKHSGGGSNGVTNTKTAYRVEVLVSEYTSNDEATAISNENYPNEQEVVLEMNQVITAEIIITPAVDGGWGTRFHPEYKRYTTQANTGTRADVWVKNLK